MVVIHKQVPPFWTWQVYHNFTQCDKQLNLEVTTTIWNYLSVAYWPARKKNCQPPKSEVYGSTSNGSEKLGQASLQMHNQKHWASTECTFILVVV